MFWGITCVLGVTCMHVGRSCVSTWKVMCVLGVTCMRVGKSRVNVGVTHVHVEGHVCSRKQVIPTSPRQASPWWLFCSVAIRAGPVFLGLLASEVARSGPYGALRRWAQWTRRFLPGTCVYLLATCVTRAACTCCTCPGGSGCCTHPPPTAGAHMEPHRASMAQHAPGSSRHRCRCSRLTGWRASCLAPGI